MRRADTRKAREKKKGGAFHGEEHAGENDKKSELREREVYRAAGEVGAETTIIK